MNGPLLFIGKYGRYVKPAKAAPHFESIVIYKGKLPSQVAENVCTYFCALSYVSNLPTSILRKALYMRPQAFTLVLQHVITQTVMCVVLHGPGIVGACK